MTNTWQLRESRPSAIGTVHWDGFGPADGPPVVLLHGTPFSSYVWYEIAPTLAAHGHLVPLDAPAHLLGELVTFLGD